MKQQVETLRQIMDGIFNSINESHMRRGTGMFFIYKNEPIKNEEDKTEGWAFTVYLSEPGYPSRALQSIPIHKPNGMDRYQMEFNVLMTALTIFTESTLLQWNELGKMLNTDTELQAAAKEVIKE